MRTFSAEYVFPTHIPTSMTTSSMPPNVTSFSLLQMCWVKWTVAFYAISEPCVFFRYRRPRAFLTNQKRTVVHLFEDQSEAPPDILYSQMLSEILLRVCLRFAWDFKEKQQINIILKSCHWHMSEKFHFIFIVTILMTSLFRTLPVL